MNWWTRKSCLESGSGPACIMMSPSFVVKKVEGMEMALIGWYVGEELLWA